MKKRNVTISQSKKEFRNDRAKAIERFLAEFAPSDHDDLYEQMLVTLCRLSADDAERGDVKILNTSLKELRYAFKVFAPYSHIPKVSVFGSARTAEEHPQYIQAKLFAELIHQQGWMVITGAGDGIMRAGHHGASPEASFGVAISLPFEQKTNTIIADDPKLIMFNYFFTRKVIFVKEARAIVLFPGGFGTQDEGFESLTLIQTGKSLPAPVVMCDEPGGTYWRAWEEYVKRELLGKGMIDKADMNLFLVTDNAQEAVDEILRFYRRYHSSRYVYDKLVMRLNSPVPPSLLKELNDTFNDILTEGCIEQFDKPLDGEENEYPDKARLAFIFDRRNAGRLRMLIDRINAEDA